MLTIGSLFSGIGGLELGLERAGLGPVVWQVECDPYATRVLEKHWPDVARFRDVRECQGGTVLADDDKQLCRGAGTETEPRHGTGVRGGACLPAVDLICGGFPCQDVSLAGRRAGLDGARSGLWSEFARLIGEVGPRWVVAENVPGLLSVDNGRGFGTVLGDLAALGYDAWWDCLPAAAVGAPHRRDRVFVVAYRADVPVNGRGPGRTGRLAECDTGIRQSAPCAGVADAEPVGRAAGAGRAGQAGQRRAEPATCGDDVADAECQRQAAQRSVQPSSVDGWTSGGLADDSQWAVEPDVGRVAHGVPHRVDRLRCLGNAVVPQVAEVIGRWIVEANGTRSS